MAIITQRGTVDLIPEYNRALRPIFCVSEGDANSRVINLSVTSGGEAFSIPSGAMVYVAGKKQDNNIFVYRCSFTSNTVVFPITEQMSALDGIVLCELQIIENGNPLGTANFVYWVEPSPIQNGTTSESDLNLFEEAISKFENFDHFYADVEAMVTEAVANMQIREGQTVIDASLTVEGAAADAKATGDIVRAFMDALVTESTAEAAVATCDDAAGGLPLKRLVANIEPAQAGSGDPSPDNVRPISGYTGVTVTRAGKNLAEPKSKTDSGLTLTPQTDGSLIINGTFTGTAATWYVISEVFTIKAGVTYMPSIGVATSSTQILDYGLNGFGNQRPVTHTVDFLTNLRIRIAAGAVFNNVRLYPMVEVGTTAIDFEPFVASDTYPVTFPTEAGTVYGGTLTINSDGSGTLTVDKVYRQITSALTMGLWGETAVRIYNVVPQSENWGGMVCSHGVSNQSLGTNVLNIRAGADNNVLYWYMILPAIGATTIDEFKTWLDSNNVQCVFDLATPTTYALSAVQVAQMLQGVNNIWTDAASTVQATYYANTALYVEKIVNAQKGMIAGVEEAMTATQNYSVGDLMIVGDALYKATAAISSGAALVVGTNIAQTTVAEQLIALANA